MPALPAPFILLCLLVKREMYPPCFQEILFTLSSRGPQTVKGQSGFYSGPEQINYRKLDTVCPQHPRGSVPGPPSEDAVTRRWSEPEGLLKHGESVHCPHGPKKDSWRHRKGTSDFHQNPESDFFYASRRLPEALQMWGWHPLLVKFVSVKPKDDKSQLYR